MTLKASSCYTIDTVYIFQINMHGFTYRTRGHPLKLAKRKFSLDVCKYSFSRRVEKMWNNLPNVVISAPSTNAFENRLDKYWSKLDIKFDFELAMAKMDPYTATGGMGIDLR